jgi:hypothetical protein
MPIDLNTARKLSESEDHTRTLDMEPAANNVIPIRQGHCPQCLLPMGIQGIPGRSTVKVFTAEGIELWCENCYKEGEAKGTCIKYRSLSKKERKAIRKMLKKNKNE